VEDGMGIFGDIMGKIFGTGAQAQTSAPGAPSTTASPGASGGSSGAAAPQTSGASAPAGGAASVDVGQVLADMAAKNGQNLDYKRSIVDLMKLLGLDSSLQARKELADELHYTGDKNDSATMNIWLHKQVVQKLAENGGKVPDDLKH
jgi:hypothetical protein